MQKNKTVILGMSGGVDSSVAALLLKKQGYNVIGIFLRSYPDEAPYLDALCPFKGDKKIAKQVAKKLGIKLIELDYRSKYLKRIIMPMFEKYEKNLTPNPDVACNTIIKFPALWKYAKSHKADYIATGHYARIKKSSDSFQLLQAKDKDKDQSYFLYELSENNLSHTLFPNGNLTKFQVREIAKSHNFPNWDKQGSRGICFIGNLNFKTFLKKKIPNKPGPVITIKGDIVGTHPGASYFTIGERAIPSKGIIINKVYTNSTGNKRIYIADKKSNTLIIAPESHPSLKKSRIFIKNLHLINSKDFPKTNLKARIRHLGKLLPGKLKEQKNKLVFTLKKPEKEIAPGQSIVLYNKERLIGGGIIKSTE